MSGAAEPLRVFFAVDLPDAVKAEAERVADALRTAGAEDARWTATENLHLTLKFLGEIPSDRIPRLLSSAAARLARLESFSAALSGVGAFPSARAARVLWVGVGEGSKQLSVLARRLEAPATRAGAPRDRQPFRAHLTLGRLRRPAPVPIERVAGPEPVSFPVEEVVLYESRLASSGARYIPLARLPLGMTAAQTLEFAPEV